MVTTDWLCLSECCHGDSDLVRGLEQTLLKDGGPLCYVQHPALIMPPLYLKSGHWRPI